MVPYALAVVLMFAGGAFGGGHGRLSRGRRGPGRGRGWGRQPVPPPEWDRLTTKFLAFESNPTTADAAAAAGWEPLLECGDSGAPGNVYWLDGDIATMPVYNADGLLAGLMMGMLDPGPSSRGPPLTTFTMRNGTEFWALLAYFRDPSTVCRAGRYHDKRRWRSRGRGRREPEPVIGDQLTFPYGDLDGGSFSAPLMEDVGALTALGFEAGTCVPGMGKHWWRYLDPLREPGATCDEAYGMALLYNDSRLMGFTWGLTNTDNPFLPSARWERYPGWQQDRSFFDIPQCGYDAPMVQSQHVYLMDPATSVCAPVPMGRTDDCLNLANGLAGCGDPAQAETCCTSFADLSLAGCLCGEHPAKAFFLDDATEAALISGCVHMAMLRCEAASMDYGCPVSDQALDVQRILTAFAFNEILTLDDVEAGADLIRATTIGEEFEITVHPVGTYSGVQDVAEYIVSASSVFETVRISGDFCTGDTTVAFLNIAQEYTFVGSEPYIEEEGNFNLYYEFEPCGALITVQVTAYDEDESDNYIAVQQVPGYTIRDWCVGVQQLCTGEYQVYDDYDDCVAYNEALPLVADGCDEQSLQGHSQSCHFLHQTIIEANLIHCFHVGKDVPDTNNEFKCTNSQCGAPVPAPPDCP